MNKKNFWADAWERFKTPNSKVIALTCVLTVLFCATSITIVLVDFQAKWWSYFAYVLFALSAFSLGYAVFLFCRAVPHIKAWCIAKLQKNAVTNKILQNYGFRTVLFSTFTVFVSIAYGLYNGVLAIIGHSVWYGALAGYYILLVCMRGGIVLYHGKHRKGERNIVREARSYRNCGWFLIVTILALSAAILQMVVAKASFVHAGLTIYVAATYTFYKMTMSIINIIKARKKTDDYTVQALRSVNFADALVSILALQTSMIQAFGDATSTNAALGNAITGGGVCALVLALGIYMIISGNKRLRRIRENGR